VSIRCGLEEVNIEQGAEAAVGRDNERGSEHEGQEGGRRL